jgi:dihydroneopterin aldolase
VSDAVALRGMRFHALVGILPHEQQYPQPLEIDLVVWLVSEISVTGNPLKDVVDYRALYDLVAEEVHRAAVGYIEVLAASIADRAMGDARIARVEVAVRKPNAALPGPLAAAEVRVERSRRG